MPEKMQRPAEDKAVKAAEDKASPIKEPAELPGEAQASPEPPKPRFSWEATAVDAKQAMQGPWRIRVQRLGASGLWRPFVEWSGEDFRDDVTAERMLERLLR